MNCNTAQNLLSAYLDSELSGSEMQRVRRHVSECHCCQREETELRILKSLLSETPLIEPPADFEDRLCMAVLGSKREEETWHISWHLVSGATMVAAALTLFVLHLVTPAHQPTARGENVMALELQRDQTSLAGADPFLGTSTVISSSYVGP